jgi:hypothetical protein
MPSAETRKKLPVEDSGKQFSGDRGDDKEFRFLIRESASAVTL